MIAISGLDTSVGQGIAVRYDREFHDLFVIIAGSGKTVFERYTLPPNIGEQLGA